MDIKHSCYPKPYPQLSTINTVMQNSFKMCPEFEQSQNMIVHTLNTRLITFEFDCHHEASLENHKENLSSLGHQKVKAKLICKTQ